MILHSNRVLCKNLPPPLKFHLKVMKLAQKKYFSIIFRPLITSKNGVCYFLGSGLHEESYSGAKWRKRREVNKNNLLGEQFRYFGPKSGKIINWVGSLQFLSALTDQCVTLWKFWDTRLFQCQHTAIMVLPIQCWLWRLHTYWNLYWNQYEIRSSREYLKE